MFAFWEGFEKRAIADVGRAIGRFSRKAHASTPIPGMRMHPATPKIIPGHGAVAVSKSMKIKGISQTSKKLPEPSLPGGGG
jgi:hypothetical protein